MKSIENQIEVLEDIFNDMYENYHESNYEGYDVSKCYDRNLLEKFICEVSKNGVCSKDYKEKYLELFIGLSFEFSSIKEKEAIKFFIELLK